MIDIHSHILPGIDDGAEDLYETLEMAAMAADIGVKAIVATPHCNCPGVYDNYFDDQYKKAFMDVSRAIKKEGIPVKLYPGMEAFATHNLPELIVDGKIMPLNQSRYVLVEFAFREDPDFATDLLRRVKKVGAKPVVAHAERYEFVQQDPQIVYRWRQKGYVIQVNKGSILGRFGRKAEKTAEQVFRHNLVSVVGSDAHSPYQRTPYLLDAYERLCEIYSQKYVDVLFCQNPSRICSNKPILALKPIPFSSYGQ